MNSIKSFLFVLICFSFFSSYTNAKDINLFGGLIRIQTDNDGDSRQNFEEPNGHYEMINGKLVFIEDAQPSRRDRHNNEEVKGHYEVVNGELVFVEDRHPERGDGRNRIELDGHYEIINGELVFVEDSDRPRHKEDPHIIGNSYHRGEWVLLTRIQNQDFDWIIAPSSERHKIEKLLKRGYQRTTVSGRKRHCYESGEEKERMWHRYKHLWR